MTTFAGPDLDGAASPPWWNEHAVLTLELGVGGGPNPRPPGRWDVAEWDDDGHGLWGGYEPVWTPVSACRLLGVSVSRGRERWYQPFGASTASVAADDPLGALSWDQGDDQDALEIRPGRQMRLRALHVASGVVYDVWRGYIETIDDRFQPYERPAVTFTGQDAIAQLGRVQVPKLEAPVGAGELTDERVDRLLDLANWPPDWRELQAGRITVIGTDLSGALSDELGKTVEAEGGALFATRDGKVAFRNRDWLRTEPYAVDVQATIGGPSEEVAGASYEMVRSASDVVNDVQFSREGGPIIRVIAPESISRYRTRALNQTGYQCETDDQVELLAQRTLSTRSSGQTRIRSVRIIPRTADEFAFVLAVDYGWTLQVTYPPAPPVDGWSRTVSVQGITHSATPEGWETELRVDDTRATVVDTWDTNRGWDRATWTEAL